LSADPVPVDNGFVAAVRAKLSQTPLASQIYGQFKSDALFDHSHDLSVAAELNPNGGRVYMVNGKELDSLSIPGLFTAYGYTDIFLKKGRDTVKQASAQNWVLGDKSQDSQSESDRLYGDFLRLYLADYQKQWDAVLSSVKIRPQQTNNQIIETLDLLSRPDSPLKLLLQTVEKNTALSRLSAEAAAVGGLSKAVAGATAALPDSMTQKMLDLAKNQVGSGNDPVKALETNFEPYNQQVRMTADRPAAIDATLLTLKNLHDYLLQASASPDKKASLIPGSAQNPVQAAKRDIEKSLPGPVAASLSNLTSAGGDNLKSDAKQQLNESLKTAVSMPCSTALAGRYPFARNTPQDVLMSDFVKIFAANGVMDQYFNSNLKALVDTASVQWKELTSDNELGLSALTLRQFQIAARIRDAFFAGGSNPQVKFELKPVALDDRVGTFRLNIEGQELLYQHGPEQITQFQWPGVNSSAGVRLVFETLDGKQVSRFKEGSWALFRMFDEFNIERTALPERFNLTVQVEGLTARFELRAASVNNPFGISEYQSFRCPESL
jgi:type VI secretion system protein ImpL